MSPCSLALAMNKLTKTQKSDSLVRLILHIFQNVQTQIHCHFNGSFFCSVVEGGTSHFYSFFSVNILARVDFLV